MNNDTEGSVIWNEDDVQEYTLPELGPLEQWPERREELLKIFRQEVYGMAPPHAALALQTSVTQLPDRFPPHLGKTVEVDLRLQNEQHQHDLKVLVYLPDQPTGLCFLGLNFSGNHTVSAQPSIAMPSSWVGNRKAEDVHGPIATETGRGCLARRWPIAEILARGHALATVYSGDFAPDHADRWRNGALQLFPDLQHLHGRHGPGTLATWSWGLSRAYDALQQADLGIQLDHIVALGHSRMGKAALWAAAQDQRFSGAWSNGSGCTGAALSRRRFGERLLHLTQRFPHWTCEAYRAYVEQEEKLPIDQHQLLALVAPRPLYVSSASLDHWADPRGEFASCIAAQPAWRSEAPHLPGDTLPAPGERALPDIGYHCRPGPHDMLQVDWWHAMDYFESKLLKSGLITYSA